MLEREYRTVAFLRYDQGEPMLDGFLSVPWPKGLEKGAIGAICTIEEIDVLTWLTRDGFDEAVTLVNAYDKMQLRARVNLMEGPFIFTTGERMDEATTLSLILERKRRRKGEREEGA